jgi:hypothetical protein
VLCSLRAIGYGLSCGLGGASIVFVEGCARLVLGGISCEGLDGWGGWWYATSEVVGIAFVDARTRSGSVAEPASRSERRI